MSLKKALGPLCVALIVLSPGVAHAEQIAMFTLSGEFILDPGTSTQQWLSVQASEALTAAEVEVRVDGTLMAAFADVTTTSPGCAAAANVVTCHWTMDLPQSQVRLAQIKVTAKQAVGRQNIGVTGTVNGIQIDGGGYAVDVGPHADLAAIGATMSAVGQTKVTVHVGVQNVGTGPADFGTSSEYHHPVVAYVYFGPSTYAESATYQCAGWGPYAEGWGWLDPGRGSNQYACIHGHLEPGETVWFDIVFRVDPSKPIKGEITTVPDGINDKNDKARILVNTSGDALPTTGPPTAVIAATGGSLLAAGILLFLLARGTRSRRPVR
jgi:hypothetical protein